MQSSGYHYVQIKILPEFRALIATQFASRIDNKDFLNNAEGVRREINDWISGRTNQLIRELLPYGVLDVDTRLVLVNAIYFKGTCCYIFLI